MPPDNIMLDASPLPCRIPWTPDGELEVLTFDLRGETFALEAVLVREIVDLLPETKVPGAAPLVGSVVNFRGKIIPLADLGLAFAKPASVASCDSRIVVIELDLDGEACFLGLKTDRVHEVATLSETASEDAPVLGLRCRRDYVRGLVRRADDVVVLPDLRAIFDTLNAGAGGATIHSIH